MTRTTYASGDIGGVVTRRLDEVSVEVLGDDDETFVVDLVTFGFFTSLRWRRRYRPRR